ncbi:MAG: crotonase, partial [bacterium]|nr:crotonase [bacterium]
IVGLDTIANVTETLKRTVKDEAGDIWEAPDFVKKLIEQGSLGRKSGAGFYKMIKNADGSKQKLVLDWKTGDYRPEEKPRFESLGKALKTHDPAEKAKILLREKDRATDYFNRVNAETLAYSSHRLGEIADSIADIDNALKWGFNAEAGPFEGWDLAGVPDTLALMREKGIEPGEWVKEMVDAGISTFYRVTDSGKEQYSPATKSYVPVQRPSDYLVLAEIKRDKRRVVLDNPGASIVDLGDGIACVEFHSTVNPKMNPIDEGMMVALGAALEIVPESFRGLVIHHQNQNFSAGANLNWLLAMSKDEKWDVLDSGVRAGQEGLQAARRSPLPVVTAPFGMTLGGGAEITMTGDRVCAHAELYIGQVEVGVGLVPGACGHLRLIERVLEGVDQPMNSNLPFLRRAFELIAMGKVSASAAHAREMGFLRTVDNIELNRDRQLWTAKRMAIALDEEGYQPPRPRTYQLPGNNGLVTLQAFLHNMKVTHWASEHDTKIGMKIANVLCGGDTTLANPVTEERILELEREAFLSLCGERKSQERMEHMLKTGKPLRN